jgi:hypothetical protein
MVLMLPNLVAHASVFAELALAQIKSDATDISEKAEYFTAFSPMLHAVCVLPFQVPRHRFCVRATSHLPALFRAGGGG